MKKISTLALLSFTALLSLTGCNPASDTSNSTGWKDVEFVNTTEINIGTKSAPTAADFDELGYTEKNPLKVALVTDSGTLNDHSFNESSWKGVNEWAVNVGGGTLTESGVKDGKVHTQYYQPADKHYDTTGRLDAMKEAKNWGANIIVLPGYLFQPAIKRAIDSKEFDDVNFLALDCTKTDDDNNYAPYEYTDKITSITYKEEQSGFLAGYGAAYEGYKTFGFVGGMAVPAVIKYGSGYVQGIAKAFEEMKVSEPAKIQYYYAGAFASTPAATSNATAWYSNGSAEVIFACGGAVYQSVVEASKSNNNKPWIGVDVNQHADTGLGTETLNALVTSAMKNLKLSVEVALTNYVDNDKAWGKTFAGNVVNVGAESGMCKLPTPEEDDDPTCWNFKKFTKEEYKNALAKIADGTYKVNGFSDDSVLKANNFGVNPDYAVVNYID